jgi:hypothetical protein
MQAISTGNIDFEKLTTISITLDVPRHSFQYAILCDRTAEYATKMAEEHPDWWVFIFGTKRVVDFNDYMSLSHAHIFQPFYVGNCRPLKVAISEVVRISLESLTKPLEIPGFAMLPAQIPECVLDESRDLADWDWKAQ